MAKRFRQPKKPGAARTSKTRNRQTDRQTCKHAQGKEEVTQEGEATELAWQGVHCGF